MSSGQTHDLPRKRTTQRSSLHSEKGYGFAENLSPNNSYPNQPRRGSQSTQSADTEKGRRPQGVGMNYTQSDNKGSDLDRGYLLSVNSVSALCVLCGGKVWFVGV